MREIEFYRTDMGKCPIEEFLDSLSGKPSPKNCVGTSAYRRAGCHSANLLEETCKYRWNLGNKGASKWKHF